MKNLRRISDKGVAVLKDAVVRAVARTHDYVTANQERLSDIYTGRDPGGTMFIPASGVPLDIWLDATKAQHWRVPDTGANLLMSRLLQVFVSSTPGRPRLNIAAKSAGAQRAAEQQEIVTDTILDGSCTQEAVRRAAWLDPIQNHVGVRLCENAHSKDATDKVKWEVIEALDCGEEPFSRRFKWHARVCQWGSLAGALRNEALRLVPEGVDPPNPWDAVALTEVFDTDFALEDNEATRNNCRIHVFVNFSGKFYRDVRAKRPNIGDYIATHDVGCCPLDVTANLEPAPYEDVSPAEAAAWIPLLNMIQNTVVQMEREGSSTNNTTLYDRNAIGDEQIVKLKEVPPGKQILLGVNVVDNGRGISHTMRPVERNSILPELELNLRTFMSLLDDVTGVGPQDRGLSINPSKSATEASVLSASSSRRTAARLRTQARRWENMARILFEYQREYFGKYLEIPVGDVIRKIEVPSPETARFAFSVSLDEMENLSRRGRLDTQMMGHQLIVNHAVAFPNGESMLVAESLRRTLHALGWVDADAYTTERRALGSPEDRYTKMLESGKDYVIDQNDDPIPHIGFLGQKLAEATATGNDNIPVDRLLPALQKLQIIQRQREMQASSQGGGRTGVVPGVSAQGDVDNQMVAQTELGLPPRMSAQTLR